MAERLLVLGYQWFIVSYRLRPYSQAESALDLDRAIRYVRFNAKAYGIAEDHIAIDDVNANIAAVGHIFFLRQIISKCFLHTIDGKVPFKYDYYVLHMEVYGLLLLSWL